MVISSCPVCNNPISIGTRTTVRRCKYCGTRMGVRRVNPDFFTDSQGIKHPIRASADYDPSIVNEVPKYGFHEIEERNNVLDGNQPKLGITRDQMLRFFKRRDATIAAMNFQYRNKVSAKDEIDSYIKEGFTRWVSGGPTAIKILKDSTGESIRLRHKEAQDYYKVAMNTGPFARNY